MTGPGSREDYQGSFSAGPGFSVAFDNVWGVFVTTGGGNDNISPRPQGMTGQQSASATTWSMAGDSTPRSRAISLSSVNYSRRYGIP